MKQYLFILILLLTVVNSANAQKSKHEDLTKFAHSLSAITNLYVDSVSGEKLVEDAIIGMLGKLDPHSSYFNKEEAQAFLEPLSGNFDGIGVHFNMLTDTLYIIQVVPGGPSAKAGILPGDRVIMVDDTLIAGVKMQTADIMKRLRGKKGSVVRIQVLRNGIPEPIEFKVTRDQIPIYSLDASYMVDKNTGYIKLSRFGATTIDEFNDALKKLQDQGMKKLILDLQYNGGGHLDAAVKLVDEFLDKGKLIVYTEGDKVPRKDEKSTSGGRFEKGDLVVLVDESSASASEIVAGALQDWDRAVIVGRRTFGKGLVQKPIYLPDASMLRLTISRYYTPTGRSIQKPYEKGNSEQYNRDLIDRYNRGELAHTDSLHFPDSTKYNTLTSHRRVYGGGGIMPDVFIPLDTARYTNYLHKLMSNEIAHRVSLNYVDRHRDELKSKYPDIATFKKDFSINDEIVKDLQNLATASKIELNEAEYQQSLPLLSSQIKALIARDLFDINAYYQIINEENESLKEALYILQNESRYKEILQK